MFIALFSISLLKRCPALKSTVVLKKCIFLNPWADLERGFGAKAPLEPTYKRPEVSSTPSPLHWPIKKYFIKTQE